MTSADDVEEKLVALIEACGGDPASNDVAARAAHVAYNKELDEYVANYAPGRCICDCGCCG